MGWVGVFVSMLIRKRHNTMTGKFEKTTKAYDFYYCLQILYFFTLHTIEYFWFYHFFFWSFFFLQIICLFVYLICFVVVIFFENCEYSICFFFCWKKIIVLLFIYFNKIMLTMTMMVILMAFVWTWKCSRNYFVYESG